MGFFLVFFESMFFGVYDFSVLCQRFVEMLVDAYFFGLMLVILVETMRGVGLIFLFFLDIVILYFFYFLQKCLVFLQNDHNHPFSRSNAVSGVTAFSFFSFLYYTYPTVFSRVFR
jgi:hypothetical protein